MRNVILALLAAGIVYGYEMKQAIDRLFGTVLPPINVGQIYTTLQRLERDGLVSSEAVHQERRPDRVIYQITDTGREALKEWFVAPGSSPRLRDDLFMKLVLAQHAGVMDPRELVEHQSRQYFQALSDLDSLVGQQDGSDRLKHLLMEGLALHLQADIRWLELWEQAMTEEEGNERDS